jgi:hypothetical protein
MQMKLLAISNMDFYVVDQRLIKFSVSGRYWKEWEYNFTVHQLFIDFKKPHDAVKSEELYNILIEYRIPKKLTGLTEICLNETYN